MPLFGVALSRSKTSSGYPQAQLPLLELMSRGDVLRRRGQSSIDATMGRSRGVAQPG